MLRELWHRLRTLGRRESLDSQLAEEMRFHQEALARDLEHDGMLPDDAALAAKRRFGNPLALRERSGATWGAPVLETILQDLRYGARALRYSPWFALVGIGAIGLAIGINAAFFTLVDRFVWQPMPVARPERLVRLLLERANGWANIRFSYTDIQQFAAHSATLTDIVGYDAEPVAFRASADRTGAVVMATGAVTGNYLTTFGATPAIGRLFSPLDDASGAPATAVISEALWDREFGRAPDIIGREILVNRVPVGVIGVVRRGFIGINPLVPDIWVTFHTAERTGVVRGRLLDPVNRFIVSHARLRPGATLKQAEAELSGMAAEPRGVAGSTADLTRIVRVSLLPRESLAPPTIETLLVVAPGMFVVGLVLVIACANLASLLLARALARQREIAVRLSLGASRARLIRQLLTESALLAALGAAVGLVLSHWTITIASRSFLSAIPGTFGTLSLDFETNWRVVGYTAAIACLSVIVFGLTPALQVTNPNLTAALKGEDTVGGSRVRRSKFRDALVAAEVAACLVLLVAAGTFVKTLRRFAALDTGIDVNRISVVRLGMSDGEQTSPLDAAARAALAARASSVPGVIGVARAAAPPLAGLRAAWPLVRAGADDSARVFYWLPTNTITRSYFGVVGQHVLRGRDFNQADSAVSAPVAIVSAATATLFWPGRNPIGQRLRVAGERDEPDTRYTIVGVVSDAHIGEIWDANERGQVYFLASAADFASREMPILVHASGDAGTLATALVRLGTAIDPNAPVQVSGLAEALDLQLRIFRYAAAVSAGVAAVGLVLAVIGLYGIVAFAVQQRRRDIGVHVALGAMPSDVLRLVLRRELRAAAIGAGIGLCIATGVARFLGSLELALAPLGPPAFIALPVLLLAVVTIAALVPASAALRIAPMQVLRQE